MELEVASLMRSLRRIFPDGFFGMEDTKATFRTLLYGATCLATNSINDLLSVCFANQVNVYATGSAGIIMKSTNSGMSWTRLNTQIVDTMNAVYFIDNNTGYVAGNNGKMYKTQDAGENWNELNTGINSSLRSIFLLNKDTRRRNDLFSNSQKNENWPNKKPKNKSKTL